MCAASTIDVREYASIQSAIDALPRDGGTVRFPAGRYEVSETLHIELAERQHLHMAGEGRATVIVNKNEDGAPLLHVVGVVGSWWPDLKITVRDFTFVGNYDSGDAIVAEYPNDTLIDACFFFGHGDRAIYLGPHGTNVTVRDCWMRDCKRGVRADNIHHLTLHGNQTRSMKDGQTQAEHVYLENNCREVRVANNHFAYGHAQGIILDQTAQHVIANNTIEGFEVGIDARGVSRDMVINANYFNCRQAIHMTGECDGYAITGNTFINPRQGGIVIECAAGSGGHAIVGNVFRKSVYEGMKGVSLADATGCVVQGNAFDEPDGEHITADRVADHVIGQNSVR